MSSYALSNLPVELFERVLEYLDILDIVRLKLVRTSPIHLKAPLMQIKSSLTVILAMSSAVQTTSSTESTSFLQGLRMATITT